MKPILLVAPKLTKLLSLVVPIGGITLWPIILFEKDPTGDADLIRHETIHIKQQKELLIIGFYLLYLIDYLYGLYLYQDKVQAYFNIRFEQEAYDCMYNQNYLEVRKPYAWVNYHVRQKESK